MAQRRITVMKNTLLILLLFSFGINAASIETVLSGSPYDGLSRTADGGFLVATADNRRVLKFDLNGNTSELYGNGIYMLGVAEDANGTVYTTDWSASQIISIDNNQSQVISTGVNSPGNVIEGPDGNLYIGSVLAGGVFKVTKSGDVSTLLSPSEIRGPLASTFDADGNYYVSNTFTAEIFRVTPNGDAELFVRLPITVGDYRIGHMAFIDGFIYATGFSSNRIYRITMDGDIEVVVGPGAEGDAGTFALNGPTGITSGDKPYEIYVASYTGRTVHRIQLDPPKVEAVAIQNHHSGLWFNREQSGHGLSLDVLNNNLIVATWYTFDNDGNQLWLLGLGPYADGLAQLDVTISENGLFPPNFNTDDVVTTNWGKFELQFNGCDTLNFSWVPDEGTGYDAGTLAMNRLTSNAGLSCDG